MDVGNVHTSSNSGNGEETKHTGAQGFRSDAEWLGWQDTKTTALLLHTVEGSVRQLSVTHLEDEK